MALSAIRAKGGAHLVLAALAFGGVVLILYRIEVYGPGIYTDSVGYLKVADSLIEGRGFTRLGQPLPYASWGPLYPLLLAAVSRATGATPLAAAGPISAIAFGLAFFAGGAWLLRRGRMPAFFALGCLALCSSPLLKVCSWALTEPISVWLTTLALYWLDVWLERPNRSRLAGLAVVVSLAWVIHYSNGILVALCGLILLAPARRWGERIKDVVLYSAIVAAPMAPWLIRNLFVAGTFTRRPPLTIHSWAQMEWPLAVVITDWLPIAAAVVLRQAPTISAAALLLLIAAGAAWALSRWRTRSAGREWQTIWIAGSFSFAYLTFQLFAPVLGLNTGLLWRYPMHAYLTVVVFGIALGVAGSRVLAAGPLPILRTRRARRIAGGGATLCGLLFALPTITLATVDARRGIDLDYASSRFAHAQVVERAAPMVRGKTVLSNSDRLSCVHLPLAAMHRPLPSFSVRELEETVASAEAGSLLVWFDGFWNDPKAYGEEYLRSMPRLALAAELPDGRIYEVLPLDSIQ